LPSLVESHFAHWIRNCLHDLPNRKDIDFTGFRVETAAQFLIRFEVLARRHNDSVFDCMDDYLWIDAFFSADLIDRLKKHVRHQYCSWYFFFLASGPPSGSLWYAASRSPYNRPVPPRQSASGPPSGSLWYAASRSPYLPAGPPTPVSVGPTVR